MKLWTCEEIAERYGVKLTTVWAWIREKRLSAIRIGKQYRVRPQDLEDFEKNTRSE